MPAENSPMTRTVRAFVIHADFCVDREPAVSAIVAKTGAEVFPAIVLPDRERGCYLSHIGVYSMVAEDEPVLVFEDDCDLYAYNWRRPLECAEQGYDLVYLGISRQWAGGSCGAYAMWISPQARRMFHACAADIEFFMPIDLMWNEVENRCGLRVWRPERPDQYVRHGWHFASTIADVRGKRL